MLQLHSHPPTPRIGPCEISLFFHFAYREAGRARSSNLWLFTDSLFCSCGDEYNSITTETTTSTTGNDEYNSLTVLDIVIIS